MKLESILTEINGGAIRQFVSRNAINKVDLWMMSQLLYDFACVLEGPTGSDNDLGCLHYCLTMAAKKFVEIPKTPGASVLPHLNCFNRNESLPPPKEIEDLIGRPLLFGEL